MKTETIVNKARPIFPKLDLEVVDSFDYNLSYIPNSNVFKLLAFINPSLTCMIYYLREVFFFVKYASLFYNSVNFCLSS